MSKTKLLLIAGDHDTATLTQKIAGGMFFSVQTATAHNFAEQYDMINPDVIVLDLLAPDMKAFEILEILKRQQSKSILLLLSGRQDSYRRLVEHLVMAAKLNIHGNLPKPFRDIDLRQQLREIQMTHLAEKRTPMRSVS